MDLMFIFDTVIRAALIVLLGIQISYNWRKRDK